MNFTELERALHPQAKLIPEKLWKKNTQISNSRFPALRYVGIAEKQITRGLFEEELSEIELALLAGDVMSHLGHFNGKNSTQQLKRWFCVLISLKDATTAQVFELAQELHIPLKMQLKGAALANRMDLITEIEAKTIGIFDSINKLKIKKAISEHKYNLCHQLCFLGYWECLKKICILSSIEMPLIITHFKQENITNQPLRISQESSLLQRLITRLNEKPIQPQLQFYSRLASFSADFFSTIIHDGHHLWILEWLQQEASEDQWNEFIQPMIRQCGNNWLLHAATSKSDQLDIWLWLKKQTSNHWDRLIETNNHEILHKVAANSHISMAQFLLLSPNCFDHALFNAHTFSSCIDPFIRNQLDTLRYEQKTRLTTCPSVVFDLTHIDQINLCLLMLKHLIITHGKSQSSDLDSLDDISFLLSIPAITTQVHKAINRHRQGELLDTTTFSRQNELLRIAIILDNEAVANLLLSIPSVYNLALQHEFYQTDEPSKIDRILLAQRHRPIVAALQPADQSRLEKKILSQLKQLIPELCPNYPITDRLAELILCIKKIITDPDAEPFLAELAKQSSSSEKNTPLEVFTKTPLLFFLSHTEEGEMILNMLLSDTTIHSELMDHVFFLDRLFTPQLSGSAAAASAFYFLTRSPLFNELLLHKLQHHDDFKRRFIDNPYFFPSFLSKRLCEPYINSSVFWNMAETTTGRMILNTLCNDRTFKESLTIQGDFITTLFAQRPDHESIFYLLVVNHEHCAMIENLLIYSSSMIIYSLQFLQTLFSRETNNTNIEQLSILYLLAETEKGRNILLRLFSIEAFRNKIMHHPDFLTSLLSLTKEKTSILILMADEKMLLNGIPILQYYFSCPETVELITSNPQRLQDLCNTLFTTITYEKDPTSVFNMWFNTSTGHMILKQLLKNQIIKTQMLKHLGLKNPELSTEWMLENKGGFFLIALLIHHNLLQLLQNCTSNPTLLLKNPQIQQLIYTGQLNANCFLFLAASESESKSDNGGNFLECINNPLCSPWAITTRGYSLADFITDLRLSDEAKTQRKQILNQAIKAHSQHISEHNLRVHLYQLGAIHTEVPDSDSPPIWPNVNETSAVDYEINGVLPCEIQSFNQHIDWICSQPQLNAYYNTFSNLRHNVTIRKSSIDYLSVLDTLKRLCPWMNYYLLRQISLPEPYPDWADALSLCATGVQTALQEMRDEFSNQSALNTHIQQAFSEAVSYYNSLFSTSKVMEVHVPQNTIKSTAGLISTISDYDVYLMRWSTIQQRWAAQRMMDLLFNPADWISALVEPLEINPALFLITEPEALARGIVLDMTSPETLATLNKKYTAYQRSPLFDDTFNLSQFYALISDTNEDDESHQISITLRTDLLKILSEKATSYLHRSHLLTDAKIVHIKSDILWGFLTHPKGALMNKDMHHAYDELLVQCADAIDSPAFIKSCLLSHQDQWDQIDIDKLHYAPQGKPSIFITLITNPFYLEELFGFKFSISQSHIGFKPARSALSVIGEQLISSEKTILELELVLHQPGSLFFWLYYLQADGTLSGLFNAILIFALDSPLGIRTYDSLIPLLIDMHQSASVSEKHKILVSSFLRARLDEQFKAQNVSFLQTLCALTMIYPPENPNKIMYKLRENPWVVNTLYTPRNWEALCYLVHEDQAMLDEVSSLMIERKRNPHSFFPEANTVLISERKTKPTKHSSV